MITIYEYINNCVYCGNKAELRLTLNHTPGDDYNKLLNMVYCPNCGSEKYKGNNHK